MFIDCSENVSFSYDQLIDRAINDSYYFKSWQYPSFKEYIINLFKALYYGQDIILLDKDFSTDELEKLEITKGVEEKIDLNTFKEVPNEGNFIQKIRESNSKIIIYTSGTTGIPQEVTHTVKSLTRMTRFGERYKNDIWGLAYNPTHMAGLQVLFQSFFNKNTLVYLFELNTANVINEISRYQVTHLSATPTFYRMLISKDLKFNNIKRITLGGEKSNKNILELVSSAFPNAKINNIYASTELGSLFVSDGENFKVPESLTGKIKIIDDELLIKSELLPDKKWVKDEWYKTGDIVKLVSSNPLTFVFKTRKSDKINVGGYSVSLVEVEDAIRKLKNVSEVQVFAKENSVLGNIICANIIKKVDTELTSKEVRQELKESLQEFKIPAIIKFVETIELTRTGKISRK